MGRRATGSTFRSHGAYHLRLPLPGRPSCKLGSLDELTDQQADAKQALIVGVALRLKKVGQASQATSICRDLAAAEGQRLDDLLKMVDRAVCGRFHPALPTRKNGTAIPTFGQFAEKWTSGLLARLHQDHVKDIGHDDNKERLAKYVLPIVYDGRRIEDIPINEFTQEHADHIMAQPNIPDGSRYHVAQIVNRVCELAVSPARVLEKSPLVAGWMPSPNPPKNGSFLFPSEDAQLMGNKKVNLVWRVFWGFLAREGIRAGNAVEIKWSDLVLDIEGSTGGHLTLDDSKTGEPIVFALDPGTAEALRRWKRLCPSDVYVFPANAVKGHRRKDGPMAIGATSRQLRAALKASGVKRERLFSPTKKRMRFRAHDLRATFVTLSLANGKTDDWVRARTLHAGECLRRYRRMAQSVAELNLGGLKSLYEAIPELARV